MLLSVVRRSFWLYRGGTGEVFLPLWQDRYRGFCSRQTRVLGLAFIFSSIGRCAFCVSACRWRFGLRWFCSCSHGFDVGASCFVSLGPCGAALRFRVRTCRLSLGWGQFCSCSRGFDVGFSCLSLLATVRGGTSFLFPTAKKKRSKENAYKRQPVGVSVAQSRPWSESRIVPARSTHS